MGAQDEVSSEDPNDDDGHVGDDGGPSNDHGCGSDDHMGGDDGGDVGDGGANGANGRDGGDKGDQVDDDGGRDDDQFDDNQSLARKVFIEEESFGVSFLVLWKDEVADYVKHTFKIRKGCFFSVKSNLAVGGHVGVFIDFVQLVNPQPIASFQFTSGGALGIVLRQHDVLKSHGLHFFKVALLHPSKRYASHFAFRVKDASSVVALPVPVVDLDLTALVVIVQIENKGFLLVLLGCGGLDAQEFSLLHVWIAGSYVCELSFEMRELITLAHVGKVEDVVSKMIVADAFPNSSSSFSCQREIGNPDWFGLRKVSECGLAEPINSIGAEFQLTDAGMDHLKTTCMFTTAEFVFSPPEMVHALESVSTLFGFQLMLLLKQLGWSCRVVENSQPPPALYLVGNEKVWYMLQFEDLSLNKFYLGA